MQYYAFLFLSAVVIITGLLGFGAMAFAAKSIVTILIFAFLIRSLFKLINHSSPDPKIKGRSIPPRMRGVYFHPEGAGKTR